MAAAQFKRASKRFNFIGYLFALLYTVTILVPLYFVVISAFKETGAIFSAPLELPSNWDFANFFKAQDQANLFGAMRVSAIIAVQAEILTLVLGFMAAYAVARIPSRLAFITETAFGLGFLIPAFALIVPVFLLAARVGLLYDPIYLVIFYTASRLPLTVVFLASYMRDVPKELEDAARIDGANHLQIIRNVTFPLTISGVVTVLLLNFIFVWNEFLFALILLPSDTRTVQLVVPILKSERLVDYGLVAAGVVMSIIPVYLVFVFFQERITSGMLSGSLKN